MAQASRHDEVSEMRADMAELRHLLNQATRPRVRTMLENQVVSLESKIAESDPPHPEKSTPPPAAGNPLASSTADLVDIASFTYDETDTTVTIRVMSEMEGVGTLPSGSVSCTFGSDWFDLRVQGLRGRTFRLRRGRLHANIDPENSKYLVKENRVVVILRKASKGTWGELVAKKSAAPPRIDKEDDPTKSIMSLMKNMYDEGDDEMKRMIAKAWTDSQDGKTPGRDKPELY